MPIPSDTVRTTFAYRDKFAPVGSQWFSASFDFFHNNPSSVTDLILKADLLSNSNPPNASNFKDVNLGVASMQMVAIVRANGTRVGWWNYQCGSGFTNVIAKSGQVLVNKDYGDDASSGSLLPPNSSLLIDKQVTPAIQYTTPGGRTSSRTQAGRVFVAAPLNSGISPYTGAVTRSIPLLLTYGNPLGTPVLAWNGWAPCVISGPNATNSPAGRRQLDECRLDKQLTTQRDRVRKEQRFAPLVP